MIFHKLNNTVLFSFFYYYFRGIGMNHVLAVILGGGRGTRLYPLTRERSKPAVPLAGKYRLIDIPISNCINSGINRIFVLTQFLAQSLNHHVFHTYRFDGFRKEGFVNILAAEQTDNSNKVDWYQGTADAVRKTLRHTNRYKFDQFLILSGDHIYRMDYDKMIREHRGRGADVSVAALEVNRDIVPELGVMDIDDDGRIARFVEKPQDKAIIDSLEISPDYFRRRGEDVQSNMFLANMGVYVFNRQAMIDLLSSNDAEDFGKQILPTAIEQGLKVYSHRFNGYWEDIGTIKAFFDANLALAEQMPKFTFYDENDRIFTHGRYLPPSKFNSAYVEKSLITEGSIVEGAEIKEAVVGIRSIVRHGSKISSSIIMGADYYETEEELKANPNTNIRLGIGENCNIHNAIVDKNTRIGNNVTLIGGDKPDKESPDGWMLRDGILVIMKRAEIPDNTVIDFS